MRTLVKFSLIAIAFISIITACETIAPQGEFSGKLLSNTECKSELAVIETEKGDTLSCIEYEYEDGVLHLQHINAGFNCCPGKIYTTFQLNNNIITVTESEKEAGCKCNCLYDLDVEIIGIEAKTYQIEIVEPFIGEQEKLSFTINLAKDKSGTVCVNRTTYPWAMNR